MQLNELKKILLEYPEPPEYFEELRRKNQLGEDFGELESLIGVPQNENYHREGDVWTHTMLVLGEASRRRDIVGNPCGFMLSALCHDFGKAVCTEKINGVIHAYRHEEEGIPLAEAFLKRIGADESLTEYVLKMVEYHMLPNIMAEARSKSKSTNKLFDSVPEPFDLVQLSICDGLGKIPQSSGNQEFLMTRLKRFNEIMQRPYVRAEDLIGAGVTEKLDEVLEYSHKLRLAGFDKENTLRQSVAYARKVLKI
ncbi:MAG: HD domain-containing protein [Ruminococcus flavefaciens]|nr:HD domain-containing protein [Ruminococcus flavefaciens]MCM1229877.1 HD domain-containing protein [Ruminococcus flavefaciens]